jgi:hypothetical protein
MNVPPEFRLPSCDEKCLKRFPGARWVRLEKHPWLENIYLLSASSEHAYLHSVAALKETSLGDHFLDPSLIPVPQDATLDSLIMMFSRKVQLPCWLSGCRFAESAQTFSGECSNDWMNLFWRIQMESDSPIDYFFKALMVKDCVLPEDTFLYALVAPLQQTPEERACSRYVTK